MIIIEVKNDKSLEQALKSYKFKIYKIKQIQQLQERKEYKKPSVVRRHEIKKAQYKQKNRLVYWESSSFLSLYFLPNISSVDVKPSEPKANRPITSTKVSSGQRVPLEKIVTNNDTIKDRTQIIPTNLLEECVNGPEPIKDLKNLIITPNLIFLVYNNHNGYILTP